MTGTVNTNVVKDFVLRMDQTLEDGWGPFKICVICDSTAQTLPLTYNSILVQQVRNCATSLVINPS
jgi:hypothetical protein